MREWWQTGELEGCGKKRDVGIGKEPPMWNAEKLWQRSVCSEAKIRFEDRGGTARSLTELELVYKDCT